MSFMLFSVVCSVAILAILIGVQAIAGDLNNGIKWALSARDTKKDDTVFLGRTRRTVANHIEGMLIFVPLAFVAHLMGLDGDMIVKGGWIYIISRALYPLTYWSGLPYFRTIVWFASLIGTGMVFFQIVSAA